jgi:hypothetical protein
MPLVHADEGVWSRTAVGYCSESAPSSRSANAVNLNKTASAVDWFARFLPGRH